MKRHDPTKVFTCVSCKRTLPRAQRDADRHRCSDKTECRQATAVWLGKESFADGATIKDAAA